MRIEKGLTQKELAALVQGGLDYTYIGKIERGEQLPSLKILSRISDALSVPLDYFFDQGNGDVDDISFALRNRIGGREFLKAVSMLREEDIPLITEIINLLQKHRSIEKGVLYSHKEELLLAAERPPH